MKKNKENPLTLSELEKYHKKTLAPFLKENFVTKKEFESFTEIATTKENLKIIEKKLGGISTKKDIKNLNKQLTSLSDDLKKNNQLETRVVDIQNVLSMPAFKK